MFNLLQYRLEQEQLSYRLTILPVVFTAVFTDYVVRASSINYSSDLIKFIELRKLSKHHYCCEGRCLMRYLGVVPVTYGVYNMISLVATVTLLIQQHFSLESTKRYSAWDGLMLPLCRGILTFYRAGTFWCALWFLTLFGKQVMERFELLCAQILERSGTDAAPGSPDTILAVVNEPAGPDRRGVSHVQELREKAVEMKTAFEVYLKIGGAFSFALVMHIAAFAFYFICGILFKHENSDVSFPFIINLLHCVMAALTFLTVAEVGHQIRSKVWLCFATLLSHSKI